MTTPETRSRPRQSIARSISTRTLKGSAKGWSNEIRTAVLTAGFGVSIHLFAHAAYQTLKGFQSYVSIGSGLFCFVVFGFLAYAISRHTSLHEGHSVQSPNGRSILPKLPRKILVPILACCSAVGLLMFAFGLEKLLLKTFATAPQNPPYLSTAVISFIGMVLFLFLAHRYTDIFSHLEVKTVPSEARHTLIFLVSSENFRIGKPRLKYSSMENDQARFWFLDSQEHQIYSSELRSLPLLSRVDQVIENANCGTAPPWPWQQILRGLRPHLEYGAEGSPQLQRIFLIGSTGEKGSFQALPRLRRFLKDVLGKSIDVRIAAAGIEDTSHFTDEKAHALMNEPEFAIDFEDFSALVPFFEKTLNRIASRYGTPFDQIMIDATGGLKTTSIAAAAITLKSRVRFQYVRTAGNGEVLQFDIGLRERGH